jgi:hypothetical protein
MEAARTRGEHNVTQCGVCGSHEHLQCDECGGWFHVLVSPEWAAMYGLQQGDSALMHIGECVSIELRRARSRRKREKLAA